MQMNTTAYKPDERDQKKKYVMVKEVDSPSVKMVDTTHTAEETKLLTYYRALDEKRREKLLAYAEFLTMPADEGGSQDGQD